VTEYLFLNQEEGSAKLLSLREPVTRILAQFLKRGCPSLLAFLRRRKDKNNGLGRRARISGWWLTRTV
jgi:hypothetical protein